MKTELVEVTSPVPTDKNRYRVPKAQWDKWDTCERCLFNDVFGELLLNQYVMRHPDMKEIPEEQWRTLAWNAAWTAAEKHRVAELREE